MRQITKHDVNKLTAMQLKAQLPFQVINDGEIIAVVLPVHDVNKLKPQVKARHDVNKATELRFSKASQASGTMH